LTESNESGLQGRASQPSRSLAELLRTLPEEFLQSDWEELSLEFGRPDGDGLGISGPFLGRDGGFRGFTLDIDDADSGFDG
jgi:hypothetical protein